MCICEFVDEKEAMMPSKKQYSLVPNNEFDLRIPLHSDEAFQHGISFQAQVSLCVCMCVCAKCSRRIECQSCDIRIRPLANTMLFVIITSSCKCCTLRLNLHINTTLEGQLFVIGLSEELLRWTQSRLNLHKLEIRN